MTDGDRKSPDSHGNAAQGTCGKHVNMYYIYMYYIFMKVMTKQKSLGCALKVQLKSILI